VNDNFSIGMSREAVTMGFELLAQFQEVKNLSIEHHPDGSVLVENRLVTASKVNDAKPSHSEAHAVLHKHTFVVWSAMYNRIAHAMDRGCINSMRFGNDSGYSTHAVNP
jgi:hypothetical protein